MEVLVLKTYDDVEDRSPMICGVGAFLIALLAWRELSRSGEMGLRFWLMLLTVVAFSVAANLLRRRHRIHVEVMEGEDGKGQLKILRRGQPEQVISEAEFGYVKLEKSKVTIHHYEEEDLRRTSFSTKGASKKRVAQIVEVLEKWKA